MAGQCARWRGLHVPVRLQSPGRWTQDFRVPFADSESPGSFSHRRPAGTGPVRSSVAHEGAPANDAQLGSIRVRISLRGVVGDLINGRDGPGRPSLFGAPGGRALTNRPE